MSWIKSENLSGPGPGPDPGPEPEEKILSGPGLEILGADGLYLRDFTNDHFKKN